MIIAFIAAILALFTPSANCAPVTVIPPMPMYAPNMDKEWELYHAEAKAEYADEFTALFNSYEVKRSKNGRVMIRQGNSGSFKFAKKG